MSLNKNLQAIVDAYSSGKRGIVLEGGSRSGKSWSIIDFLIAVATKGSNPQVVNIVKETYAGFKTTLYRDFNNRLPMFGLTSPAEKVNDVPQFRLFDTHFLLMGADQPSKYEGAGSDFFWINEAMAVKQAIFDHLEMRCSRFWMMDFNPSASDHWIFNRLGKRPDVAWCHSTMLDNPYIGKWEKKKIQGYEPTPENIAAGTADDFMWTVYGLGLRASPQGVIFRNVEWIEAFPTDIDMVTYGMDFGYTNSPTAIVRCGKAGRNLYFEKLFYSPCDNAADLAQVVGPMIGNGMVWADRADPGMISELRRMNVSVYGANTFPGSIKFGIDFLKQHKIHLVRDVDVRKEQENYKWREIGGVALNEPVDAFNHFWDAARYGAVSEFRTE